jgi:hypothetical protein
MPRAGAFRAESPPNALRTSGGRLATEETLRGSKVVAVAAGKTKHKDVVLGSKAVAVAQGSSKTVSVSLNRAGINLLKKFQHLPVLLFVLEGTTTVGTDKVTLVGPKH